MAEYASPKNDTAIFNPIEFFTLEKSSAVSTDITGLQEEIDTINDELVVLETALSTIGLPNTTLALQTTFTTTSNGGQWTAYTASLSAGVYLVKFYVYATCSQNNGEGIKQIQSFYTIGSSSSRNQTSGLYLYAKHGNQQVCAVTFQQQFLIVATATTSYKFGASGLTYNGTNITYNNANFPVIGKGATISIMRIK
jgi:hypothetical protein